MKIEVVARIVALTVRRVVALARTVTLALIAAVLGIVTAIAIFVAIAVLLLRDRSLVLPHWHHYPPMVQRMWRWLVVWL